MIRRKISKNVPLVSVVIPTFNSSRFYKPFIRSLEKSDYKNVEFIFVDDGSTDGSFEKIKKISRKDKRFRVIQTLNKVGIAESRNIGIKESRGKYIAFAEMDMEVSSNWLTVLVNVLERDKYLAGVMPLVLDIKKRNLIQAAGIRVIPYSGWVVCLSYGKDKKRVLDSYYASLGGVGSVVRRKYVEKIKGFDSDLVRNVEDVDFGWRIWIAGGKIKFIPDVVVYHWTAKPWNVRKNELSKIEQDFHLNKVPRLILKNFELRNVVKYLPTCFALIFARALLNLFRGNFIPFLSALWVAIWFFYKLPDTLKERYFIQKLRKFDDQYLFGKLYVEGNIFTIYNKYLRPVYKKSFLENYDKYF